MWLPDSFVESRKSGSADFEWLRLGENWFLDPRQTTKSMQKTGVSPVHDLPRLLFSVRETAHMIGGISEKSVYRLIQRGLLKCSPALRHKMITADSIKAFVALSGKEGR